MIRIKLFFHYIIGKCRDGCPFKSGVVVFQQPNGHTIYNGKVYLCVVTFSLRNNNKAHPRMKGYFFSGKYLGYPNKGHSNVVLVIFLDFAEFIFAI